MIVSPLCAPSAVSAWLVGCAAILKATVFALSLCASAAIAACPSTIANAAAAPSRNELRRIVFKATALVMPDMCRDPQLWLRLASYRQHDPESCALIR